MDTWSDESIKDAVILDRIVSFIKYGIALPNQFPPLRYQIDETKPKKLWDLYFIGGELHASAPNCELNPDMAYAHLNYKTNNWLIGCCGMLGLKLGITCRIIEEFLKLGYSKKFLINELRNTVVSKEELAIAYKNGFLTYGNPDLPSIIKKPGGFLCVASSRENSSKDIALMEEFGFVPISAVRTGKTGAKLTVMILSNSFEEDLNAGGY